MFLGEGMGGICFVLIIDMECVCMVLFVIGVVRVIGICLIVLGLK